MSFKIGDRVVVDIHAQTTALRREGKIHALPGRSTTFPTCYLVEFPSGSAAYLTATEIEHVDVVTRLSDLA